MDLMFCYTQMMLLDYSFSSATVGVGPSIRIIGYLVPASLPGPTTLWCLTVVETP